MSSLKKIIPSPEVRRLREVCLARLEQRFKTGKFQKKIFSFYRKHKCLYDECYIISGLSVFSECRGGQLPEGPH